MAAERGTTVLAGMFEQGDDPARPVNTLVLRGAAEADYRKIHLYDSFGYRESDRIAAGPRTPVTADLAGFRLGLMTCYDLRFPELARALVDSGAEVLVVPAAWVAGPRKVDHWTTLVRARAIENTAYVVAVGQPGPRYTGHSLVVDPWGEVLAEAGEDAETLTVALDRDGPRRGSPHQPVPREPPSLRARYPSRPCRPPPPAAAPSERPAARGCAVPVAGSGSVRGCCCCSSGSAAWPSARPPARRRGSVRPAGSLVAVTFTAGLVARTGGRTFVYGALALALGAAVVVTDEPMLRTGAAVLTCVVTAVFAVMATVPAVTTLQAVREVLVAMLIAAGRGGRGRRARADDQPVPVRVHDARGARSRWPSWWSSGSAPGCTDSAGAAWWSCSSAAWCWR